jgi:hypothetical protein
VERLPAKEGEKNMKRIWILGLVVALVLTAVGVPVSGKQYSDWSAPVNLGPVVNTADWEAGPVTTKDGLSLYLLSNRAGGYGGLDLYVSNRTGTDQPWGTPQNLGSVINTSSNERCPYVTPDGRALIFVSDRPGGAGAGDFYISYRHDKNDDLGWGEPSNITELNSNADVYAMWGFEEDGLLTLYFGSKDGSAPGDIYSTTTANDGTFSPPAAVTELNTANHESYPVVRKDGLEMFLNSNRPGTIGGSDLWVSVRQKTSDPWGDPVNLGPLVNSAADESRAAVSWDGSTITFISTRPGGYGGWDMYTSERFKVTGKDK